MGAAGCPDWSASFMARDDAASLRLRAEDVAFVASSWVLCVEYVDDLKRVPVSGLLLAARDLPRTVIDSCLRIAAHLRERHESFYERTADETEALLADEVDAAKAEDLGMRDTFRFEEDNVLDGALVALGAGEWAAAAQWAALRVAPKTVASFWVRRDPSRQAAWDLVHAAARLGQSIERAGMPAFRESQSRRRGRRIRQSRGGR